MKIELMPPDHRTTLATIKRFDQLIAFLRDEMDWPINSDDFEELTFEYTAEELGIDTNNAAKIQEIKRLRPLVANQPWGIFFVKFEPTRLPVVALRRILSRVVLKKRASANDAERPAWAMEDLLFISNYGEGDTRQISFAHFTVSAGTSKLPTLKVLGWDYRDTALHLDHVAHELTEHLVWPGNETNADTWRQQWRKAFTLEHREVITTAQKLSVRLASLARAIRDRIHAALGIETESGRITQLMKAFRESLVHDLTAERFADMVAQTITYGLLSARIADPQSSTADDLAGHMRTNPLLRELMIAFLQVGDMRDGVKIDFDELGIADVMELLDHTNMEAVVRDFGDRNPREDPVIHFYESFLAEYDKQQKVKRGVFYTPRPVVSYIVRSLDALLRSEFGLKDGLADTATWGEMTERKGVTIPEGISRNQDFVQILDPATGTGTFLVEVIDMIRQTLKDKWEAQGHNQGQVEVLWNEYVPKHLLPRLHGYELLMAPYAIAHLKIGLKLYETGYRFGSNERARIYLTNALEPPQSVSGLLDFAIPALAHEAQAVNEVKAMHRFTVVLGNPPYSGHSANKGKWIARLIDDYKRGFPELKKPAQAKWLSDDYVKFIRLAQRECQRASVGVLGFITNHSYLDNPTFRGMRLRLMESFDEIYLVDLHGNSKKKEKGPDGSRDQNVFDIQQGVAISLCMKRDVNNDLAHVRHVDVWGDREGTAANGGKYDWLTAKDAKNTDWTDISPRPPLNLLVPRDEALSDEYQAGWSIPAIFSPNGDPAPGIVTTHDQFAISWTPEEAESKIKHFLATESEEEARAIWRLCSQNQWKYGRAREELANGFWRKQVEPILYRPFDIRTTVFNRNVAVHRRERVMQHMLTGDNLGLVTCRQQSQVGVEWGLLGVTRSIIESCAISNKTKEINYLFPLYIFPSETPSDAVNQRVPNLDSEFTRALVAVVGLELTADGFGDLITTFGPEDIFRYLYAVLHSPEYRRRYADFLKSDFPRVPLPGNRTLFSDLTRLGARLVRTHLLEVESSDSQITFPISGSNQVEKLHYKAPQDGLPGRVWINSNQYFDGIDPDTYAFSIGGYHPAQKWLKDRKGHKLSKTDIAHYGKIVAALSETHRRMVEIDDIIDRHGGWPAAFQLGKAESATAKIIALRPRTVDPKPSERYVTCVPLILLQAAAGAFGDPQTINEDDEFEWVAVDTSHRLRPGMFVAQVVGKSMESDIPDGAWCLFRAPVEGTRQGKTVLVQLKDTIDPETGQRYTVKRYASEKAQTENGWHHTRITLNPVNPDFDSIVLIPEEEGNLQVIAELVEVLSGSP